VYDIRDSLTGAQNGFEQIFVGEFEVNERFENLTYSDFELSTGTSSMHNGIGVEKLGLITSCITGLELRSLGS